MAAAGGIGDRELQNNRSNTKKASQKTFCAAQSRSMHVYPRIGQDRLMRSQVAQPAKLSYITCLAMRPVGVCFIEPYIFILHSNHKRCEGNCQDFWLKIKIYFAPEVVPQKERLAELMQTKVCNANERKIGCQSELERVKKRWVANEIGGN